MQESKPPLARTQMGSFSLERVEVVGEKDSIGVPHGFPIPHVEVTNGIGGDELLTLLSLSQVPNVFCSRYCVFPLASIGHTSSTWPFFTANATSYKLTVGQMCVGMIRNLSPMRVPVLSGI